MARANASTRAIAMVTPPGVAMRRIASMPFPADSGNHDTNNAATATDTVSEVFGYASTRRDFGKYSRKRRKERAPMSAGTVATRPATATPPSVHCPDIV